MKKNYISEFVVVVNEVHCCYKEAMEERGMLDHTIVHGVFVGPAHSG